MVAFADTARLLLRALEGQDVASNLSRVRPVSCPVDPLRRFVRPERAVDAAACPRLQELQCLLEWAYGYRPPRAPHQRPTRRAPSAGALYPIETFVVAWLAEGPRVLYYDFAGHCFYDTAADGTAVARMLGLGPGRAAVLCVAVLWRTLQRYGARGYRYCLLDTAHVAANLGRVARACRHEVELDPWVCSRSLEQLLGLECGEALVLALHCRPGRGALPVPVPAGAAEFAPAVPTMTEQPPLMCPVLQRTITFHRRTQLLFDVRWRAPWPGRAGKPDDLYAWAAGRCSARQFTGAAVPREQYERMAAVARRDPVLRGHGPALYVYGITARVNGMPVGLGPLGREDSVAWALPATTSAELTRRLADVCQGQDIVRGCAFALVVAARTGELAALGPLGYRPLVLDAGFVTADLYHEAARRGLGTTTIGGFSDAAVARLLGDASLTPVVVQIFGELRAAAEKVDAARIVGGRHP
jgi:hypothetical protein